MAQYKQPSVSIGQTVIWYNGGVRQKEHALPAMVMRINPSSLGLRIFTEFGSKIVEGARHLDDPQLRDEERLQDGAWEYADAPFHNQVKTTSEVKDK